MEVTTSTRDPDPELKGVQSKDWSSDHVDSSSSSLVPPDEERRLVRKMDLHIIPVLVALYVMSFLDRVNIGKHPFITHVFFFFFSLLTTQATRACSISSPTSDSKVTTTRSASPCCSPPTSPSSCR